MASAYELSTVAALELLMGGRDLETMDGAYTDTLVEAAVISRAEKKIIGLSGVTWTAGTITIPVAAALDDFMVYYCEAMMLRDGHLEEKDRTVNKATLNVHEENMRTLMAAAQDTHGEERVLYISD